MADTEKVERDEISGQVTTGHEWDGIKELNTPLPRWWVWVFLASVVWGFGYWIVYPAWPTLSGYTRGTAGFSSRGAVMEEVAAGRAAQEKYLSAISTTEITAIAADPELHAFALAGGASAYRLHCATCHGAGAQGAPGIANLNDDDWIWGGALEDIYTTISHGVRADDPDTRFNEMPAFGEFLSAAEIGAVAEHVLQLSEPTPDLGGEGAALYEEQCAACHGAAGEGLREMGGPRLNDAIWLYGGTLEDISAQVTAPRHGMMPAWSAKLDDATIKKLALYVHSLGGGE